MNTRQLTLIQTEIYEYLDEICSTPDCIDTESNVAIISDLVDMWDITIDEATSIFEGWQKLQVTK